MFPGDSTSAVAFSDAAHSDFCFGIAVRDLENEYVWAFRVSKREQIAVFPWHDQVGIRYSMYRNCGLQGPKMDKLE